MAYYDALIAKWPSVSGADDAAKLATLAAEPVAQPATALLTPSAILNACLPADLAALTALQLQQLSTLLSGSQVDVTQGTNVRAGIQAIFSGKTTTLQQLAALVAPYDNATVPWWQANGYEAPIEQGDIEVAGLVTGVSWSYQVTSVQDQPQNNTNTLITIVYTDGPFNRSLQTWAYDLTDAQIAVIARRQCRAIATRRAAQAAITQNTPTAP